MKPLLEAHDVTRIFGSGTLSKGRTVAVDGVSLMIDEEKPSITAKAIMSLVPSEPSKAVFSSETQLILGSTNPALNRLFQNSTPSVMK